MERYRIQLLISLFLVLPLTRVLSQFSTTMQVRVRIEYRNGLGTLPLKGSTPAVFSSQRSRTVLNYKADRVILQTSLQDVRVWGQDASTISNLDGGRFGIHEAWAEIVLAKKKDSSFKKSAVDYLAVKIGRQELLYDDSRLVGNLDWLQQGRRHNAIVFKLINRGWQTDFGFAFNQNTDAFNYNGTYYTPANIPTTIKDSKGLLVPTPQGVIPLINENGWSSKFGVPALLNPPSTNASSQLYKAMQLLYSAKSFKSSKFAGLLLVDHFGKYKLDSFKTSFIDEPGFVYGRRFNQKGAYRRLTTGILLSGLIGKKKQISIKAGLYYQGGRDFDGAKLNSVASTLSFSLTRSKFGYTFGWDFMSGNNSFSSSSVNHRFDPLYGTPHKFWGLMDYFYVGTGSPTGGLSDPYIKIKYSANKRFVTDVDFHAFALANKMKDQMGAPIAKYLGSEIDIVNTYSLNKFTTIELGISFMFATRSMEYAKGVPPGAARLNGNWSYLMVNIRPEFLLK
jgi:hypothetical protein